MEPNCTYYLLQLYHILNVPVTYFGDDTGLTLLCFLWCIAGHWIWFQWGIQSERVNCCQVLKVSSLLHEVITTYQKIWLIC